VTLDPLSVPAQRVLGSRCLYAGLLREAETSVRRALELNPGGGLTHYWLGMIHLAYRRWDEAYSAFEQEVNAVLRLLGFTLAEHSRGRTREAQAVLTELVEKHADGGAFQIAGAYAYIGDAEKSFEWLERADQQRDPGLIEIKAEMLLRNLYGDARWKAFLQRMGLADAASADAR
jgi:tetratricopeptide (TPR) repeat protein